MTLPPGRVFVVSPENVSACFACGARPRGTNPETGDRGLEFVSFNNNPDDTEVVPAGLLMTRDDSQPEKLIHTARDGFGRGSATFVQEFPQLCSECLTQMGALVGVADTTELQARVDEQDSELTKVRADLATVEDERERAEDELRRSEYYQRMFAREPKRPRAKAEAKG